MGYKLLNVRFALGALLLWALPLFGQMEIGESSMTMSGNISVGYDGAFQDAGSSSHGITAGGDGYLRGSYYDPKFLSFDFHPYYNRSQNNSDFQSIFNSSGFNGSANLFGGSHFPGFVNFSKEFSSNGTFGFPGAGGLTTHGSGQTFGVGWSELLPDKPSLSASYTITDSTSTIFGSDSQSNSGNKLLDLHSDYNLEGFRLRGFFQHQNTHANFPGFVVGGREIDSSLASNTYGISADHKMPLNGQIYGGWHRSSSSYDYSGGHTDATTDDVNVNTVLRPAEKLTLSMGMNSTSNLSGALLQQFGGVGAPPPAQLSEFTSRSTQYNATAGYTPLSGLFVQGQVTHWNQVIGGRDFANTAYGATVNYNMVRRLLGSLTFVVGVIDNTNQEGHIGTTLISNVNFSRKIDGWDVGASFNYSQNLQTLVAIYTTSNYGYGASVRRRLGYRTYWNASFSGGHSGLTQFSGFSNRSASYSTSMTYGRYALSASYSQADGASLFTPGGIVQPPVIPPVIGPNDLALFRGKSWSFGGSGSPIRKMQLTANFSRSLSNTLTPFTDTRTYNNMLNMQARYPIRKLYFTAGYTHFQQGLGAAGTVPTNVTTYFFGLSRWFNVF